MELAGEARSVNVATTSMDVPGVTDTAGEHLPHGEPEPETSTMMLRRCTALAARARVDLLCPGRGAAAEELTALLEEMASWEPARLQAPDPTMTVLAAAALQDLAERLARAEAQQTPASGMAITGIPAVLAVLQELMAGGRVDVPA